MASIYKRERKFWIKFSLPGHLKPVRESLGAIPKAKAKLIACRFELELALRSPEIARVELPAHLQAFLAGEQEVHSQDQTPPAPVEISTPHNPTRQEVHSLDQTSPTAEKVVREYVAFIRVQNDKHHCQNKITHMVRFFGTETVLGAEDAQEPPKEKTKRDRAVTPGVFAGRLFSEINAAAVQTMIDGLSAGMKTKRHYRNTFHALFEFALKRNHFTATNFRYPNPMSALPTYHERNSQIVFLDQAKIDEVLRVLEPTPSVRIAAALMIYAGLRRAETLWLRRENISADLSFLSVVNKTDEEKDIESKLKTGTRPVPILPQLRAILEPYLAAPGLPWMCPSPQGHQWDGDNFGKTHRRLLDNAGLEHTCLHYRHTFATQRAVEKWPLFRIAKVMGNSVAVCEKYYAAFIDPSLA